LALPGDLRPPAPSWPPASARPPAPALLPPWIPDRGCCGSRSLLWRGSCAGPLASWPRSRPGIVATAHTQREDPARPRRSTASPAAVIASNSMRAEPSGPRGDPMRGKDSLDVPGLHHGSVPPVVSPPGRLSHFGAFRVTACAQFDTALAIRMTATGGGVALASWRWGDWLRRDDEDEEDNDEPRDDSRTRRAGRPGAGTGGILRRDGAGGRRDEGHLSQELQRKRGELCGELRRAAAPAAVN